MDAPVIDLANCSAQWLAEQDDQELGQAIRAFAAWQPAAAAVLDNAFVMRTASILPRRDALDDLESLDDLIWDASDALPEAMPEREKYRHRWNALSETIRYRFYAIQQNPMKNLEGFKWVPEILTCLGRHHPEPTPLATLVNEVRDAQDNKIKSANLSRVLNVMEDNLLVTRERSGKEKRVRLGEKHVPKPPVSHAVTAGKNERCAAGFFFRTGTHG